MAQSYIEYSGSELSATTFNVSFNYLNIDDIKAVGFDGTDWTVLPLVASNTSNALFNITALNTTVTLQAAPSTLYSKLRIYRATSNQQLVDFQNGSRLSERDLDTAYQQGLFVAQEVSEDASTNQYVAINSATQTAIQVATAATQAIADASVADAQTAAASAIQSALEAGTRLTNFASHEVVSSATDGLIDGTNAVFNITTFSPQTEVPEAFRVTIDGIMQSPTDAYTISMANSTITFSSAPPVGSKIVVVTAASAASAVSVDGVTLGLTSTNRAEIKDAGITNVKLAGGITNDKLAGGITNDKLNVIDDNTMLTASDTSLATSESIKAYVDELGHLKSGPTNTSIALLTQTAPYLSATAYDGTPVVLDLSPIIGSNRAIVHMELLGDGMGTVNNSYQSFPNSTVLKMVSYRFIRNEGTFGLTAGDAENLSDGNRVFLTVMTNANGELQYVKPHDFPSGSNNSLIVRAYQKIN